MGRISIVSQIFLPGTLLLVSRYAKNTPRKKAITVASRATLIDRIIGSNICLLSYSTVNPYFSNTSLAKSVFRKSKKSAAASASGASAMIAAGYTIGS